MRKRGKDRIEEDKRPKQVLYVSSTTMAALWQWKPRIDWSEAFCRAAWLFYMAAQPMSPCCFVFHSSILGSAPVAAMLYFRGKASQYRAAGESWKNHMQDVCEVCVWGGGGIHSRQAIRRCLSGTVMRPNKTLLRRELERKRQICQSWNEKKWELLTHTQPASATYSQTPCQLQGSPRVGQQLQGKTTSV